jgi:putative nucleotidyltransferase with HDIG domain
MTSNNQTPLTSYMRRQEARRQRGEARGTLWQKISRAVNPRVLLIWVAFYAGAVAILFAWRESMPWRLMQRVDRDILARADFEITDPLKTAELRQEARAAVPLIYVGNEAPLNAIQGRLLELLEMARSADQFEAFFAEAAKRKWDAKYLKVEVYRILRDNYATNDKGAAEWGELAKSLVKQLQSEAIVDQVDPGPRQAGHKSQLRSVGKPPVEVPTITLQVATPVSIQDAADKTAKAVFHEERLQPLRPIVEAAVFDSLVSNPNNKPTCTPLWRYDASATTEAQRLAEQSVPPVVHEFKASDKLVPAGSVLSVPQLDLLKSEHQAYLRAQSTDSFLRQKKLCFQFGIAGIVLLITLGLAAYASLYESRTFQMPARTLGLAALLLFMVGAARLIEMAEWPYDLPVEFSVGLVMIAAALLTIAFGQRFAFGSSTALAVLVTMASRSDFGLFLTLLAAAGITVFLLKEVRTRSKVILVGSLAGLGALLTSVSVGFMAGEDIRYALIHAAVAGFAALVAGFVVQGILPQFERVFGIATSMTLLEWCDAGRPLLRLLAQNAPGTYSHSIMISQMAEEAAEAVNARGLLARVGALYHDVGKVSKPDYYVENQEARINRHDRLSPTMSMLIILGHVKDGIEMARAYGLPRVLHPFIAEHHGTTVVRYFHQAACEAESRTKRFCDRDVPESEFRYPGPKPGSKECAILMLCDGCEGAVRALSEPTPGRIESAVHQVVMDRLNDGQFDHCDISLRELKLVERSLVKSLVGIHHSRIKYPERTASSRGTNGDAEAKPAAAASGQSNGNGNGGNGNSQDRLDRATPKTVERTSEVVRQA